jgi:1-acyl-sn-glycerol-3-phosphate acyltransferase
MRLFGESLEVLLHRDALVLVYPEQAMWWNYRKPRPPKAGAYHYAAKFNVPIIPCFVTMEDQPVLDGYGFPKQKYTIHVMPPLYPDPSLSARENERAMQSENYRLCCEKYSEVYGEAIPTVSSR